MSKRTFYIYRCVYDRIVLFEIICTHLRTTHVRNYIIHIGWIYSVGLMIYLLRNVKYMLQAHNKKYLI